ncbi:sensor histidine kinase [Streptomyces albipurpureus]|uniref:histidine kinase n=1 Tax=Streptomyces albipurpureus TaxID=2897419 RepID=A0ABT0UIW1_9ACTN|nr:ATP-binding protein [Streptomyces sp. CWNU-1]MCM2388172.1 ATP-binding protein [Streptomyces sp. CWNU-1]
MTGRPFARRAPQRIPRVRLASERARLTALYGGLLMMAGCVLVTVIYLLVQDGLDARIGGAVDPKLKGDLGNPQTVSPGEFISSAEAGSFAVTETVQMATDTTLQRLLTVSAIALAAFAALSVFLAWWMAGRVLRPVSLITTTAQKLSGENLHQRIDLKAPPGELKQLADTFDQMLGRIEQLVTAQQRFAANAAHELRTPLAIQRALAEIGLADPDPKPERIRWIRRQLIDAADNSEQLIESLLLLAASHGGGLERCEPVALGETVAIVAAGFSDEARGQGIAIKTLTEPMTVEGDLVLLTHLVNNLVGNAIRYNHRGGTVRITATAEDRSLEVTNTGPVVPDEDVPLLFEPFRRLKERRHAAGEGVGLGLSIVTSIARAHGAEATAEANPGGGLTLRVVFPEHPSGSPRGFSGGGGRS